MFKNNYEVEKEIVRVQLDRKGSDPVYTIIDLEDLDRVLSFPNKWCVSIRRQASVYAHSGNSSTMLHRLIMEAPKGLVVDHINHDPLDNRKCNLRIVTNAENLQNRKGAQSNSTSGVRGVYRDIARNKWRVKVRVKSSGINIALRVDTFEEAVALAIKLREKHMPYTKEKV